MVEVAKITLESEMDLVLAHRRSMKLAELAGLSISAQTTFATAVSEVARLTIENGKNGCLILSVSKDQSREKFIIAAIRDESFESIKQNPGIAYAKRLVNKFNVSETASSTLIELYFAIPHNVVIQPAQAESWKQIFLQDQSLSPYEEIKRKNDQLKQLAEKLQESETQYRSLTNSLPLLIFSLDKEGKIKYTNEWFKQYTGTGENDNDEMIWKKVVHADDLEAFSFLIDKQISIAATTIKTQCRLCNAESGEYLWHLITVSPKRDDQQNISEWTGYAVDIHAQKVYEAALQDNEELKEIQLQLEENRKRLELNIIELNRSNEELQQFAFIASHDLQEPVRKVAYYADMLQNKYADKLDEKGRNYLDNMFLAAYRMRTLINDVLSYSQVNSSTVHSEKVDLNNILRQVIGDYEVTIKEKLALINYPSLPSIYADPSMMHQLFTNLIGNALKYSRKEVPPVINISSVINKSTLQLSLQDNGIGFDNNHSNTMFRLFQRLHSKQEYEGTGVGLALCRRIAEVHNGTISALSQPGNGSTFIVTLPINKEE